MKRVLFSLLLALLLCGTSSAFTVADVVPTTNEDGAPLTDLAAVVLYYRTSSAAAWQKIGEALPTAASIVVEPFLVGQFTTRARNSIGIESLDSNIVQTKRPNKIAITGVTK